MKTMCFIKQKLQNYENLKFYILGEKKISKLFEIYMIFNFYSF